MITRIEIDGFKTFRDFKLDLGPFQIIVGANGAGKSNLFDALQLLTRLTNFHLRTALLQHPLRGEAGELFTAFPNGRSADRMRFGVEMFVTPQIQDSWGKESELEYTRLRYELEIARRTDSRGIERLYVVKESLIPIPPGDDAWITRYNISPNCLKKLADRREPFISTEENTATITLHHDGDGGKKAIAAEKTERTVLSGIINIEYPHVFAAHEEICSWKFLQLNPEVLREPAPMIARPFIDSDGSNLAAAIARMQAEDSFILNDISRDMANLVPGVLDIEIEEDGSKERYVIRVRTRNGSSFSSRVLSDGTLRALALTALKNDPQHHGVLCFEEPENGVHPFRLKNLVEVLRELSTDFSDPDHTNLPLRQLLVNTHSPLLAAQKGILPNLLFAYIRTYIHPGYPDQSQRFTRILPLKSGSQLKIDLEISDEEESYTLAQVADYLNIADLGETIAGIKTNFI